MRKFSNKSKKEKKNAIRRKTKGNRRNNKRRTYRKKMKGGDVSDNIKENVLFLDDIINKVVDEYNNIGFLKYYNQSFNKKVKNIASDTSSCLWSSGNTEECRENKKYLFTLTVILLNYYKKRLDALSDYLNKKKENKDLEEKKLLVINFKKIIDDNMTAIEKKATDRHANKEDFNIDILKIKDLQLNKPLIENIDDILNYIKNQDIDRNQTIESEAKRATTGNMVLIGTGKL